MSARYGTLEERFWQHVLPEPNSGCWLWDGPIDELGYGRFRDGIRKVRVHRLSYEMHNGPIVTGFRVLHRCDMPGCVNPDHLRLGTDIDNVADKVRRNRQAHGRMSPSAKLTEVEVRHIRALKGQMTQRALASMFRVSKPVIMNIHHGKNWRHVPDR